MKRYIEKYNHTFKIEVHYALGGCNNFVGTMEQRGYYFSVCPVKRERFNGGWIESYTAFTGTKECILEVKRKSNKALEKAEAMITEEKIHERIDYVARKNNFEVEIEEYENSTKPECCGDRECPECEIDSLVEQGKDKWICLKCGKIFDEEWLDDRG